MIPATSVTQWSTRVPWPTRDQVEQDLVLSRLILDIAAHPVLGQELVFRGGTCLHKLHLSEPLRYSEDLDYVRATNTPIGPILDALRQVGTVAGFEVATDVGQHPKVRYRSRFDSGARLRLKVEINTHETSPARPFIRLPYQVASSWWAGTGDVLTFTPAELVATKLRALHQRRKGRDLFDLWIALTLLHLEPSDILACFEPYRPSGYTRKAALTTFAEHIGHPGFRNDISLLTTATPDGYDIDTAAALIRSDLLQHV
jgi:hypothetical protein